MNLIDNIKAINGGGIFEAYSEDALLLGGRVLKNEQDVGLSDRKVNYFYTRFDDRPLKIQKAEIQIKSCTPYEIASPKVLVLQFKEFDLNGIMYAALNVFNANYNRLRYEVDEVDIRKEIILKQETGEVKPMEGYRLVKIKYTEYMPLDGCEDITCNGDVVIPITNDVKVYINSVLRYEPSCGTDLNLTLVDQDGVSIDATYNGDEIVVSLPGDARVSNSDDSYDVNVASGGDLELPDEAITVNSAAFITKPSVKDQDIVLTDQDDNVLTPTSLSGNTIKVSTGWSRPTEWIALPDVETKTLYGLYLVFENSPNTLSVLAKGAGDMEIDWENDGTIVTSNGSIQSYTYDYATLGGAINVYTEDGSNRNYKQVIFKMKHIANFTNGAYTRLDSNNGINDNGSNQFADINADFSGISTRFHLSKDKKQPYLRMLKVTDVGTNTRFWYGQQDLDLKVFDVPSPFSPEYLSFTGTTIAHSLNDLNPIGASCLSNFKCVSVNNIGGSKDLDGASLGFCNNINSTESTSLCFNADVNILGTITLTDTNFQRAFQNCTTKKLIFASLPSQPTNMASNGGCFLGMVNLEEMIVPGLQNGFTIAGSNMGATALDAMFTSLGTANGAQTITITGNPGAATCDTTIATAKGFTIVI